MKMKYVVYGRDGDELEELDWSYNEKEAERWAKEFGEERDKWIAEGKDPGVYWPEYVVQEEEDDDREEGEDGEREFEAGDHPDCFSVIVAGPGGHLEMRRFGSERAREMWELGLRESDFSCCG